MKESSSNNKLIFSIILGNHTCNLKTMFKYAGLHFHKDLDFKKIPYSFIFVSFAEREPTKSVLDLTFSSKYKFYS